MKTETYYGMIVRRCVKAALVASLLVARPVIAAASLSPVSSLAQLPHRAGLVGTLPFVFEENRGQTDDRVRFLARGPGYALFLTEREAVLALRGACDGGETLRMRLVGANRTPRILGTGRLPGVSNYFVGNDAADWRTGVAHYAAVRYERLYPGIDLVFHGSQGQLEYDFILAPGADPSTIELEYQGAERVRIAANGDLVLSLAAAELRHHAPVVYQETNGQRRPVAGRFVRRGRNRFGFEVSGYDRSQTLIVDPTLSYSSYLGGSGAEESYSLALDKDGNVYLTGATASSNFPIAGSPPQGTNAGGERDVFIAKLNPTGSTLVYSTYLGGTALDMGRDIAVDAAGYAYVTGTTYSTDFPTSMLSAQKTFGGDRDAFVAKLNPAGTNLVFTTYLGGINWDEGRRIALDPAGNIYLVGFAQSPFPLSGTPLQPTFGGGQFDGFVAKLHASGNAFAYVTYLGGNQIDYIQDLEVDSGGNVLVTGRTGSTDFPVAGTPFQRTFRGVYDAFVAKVNSTGSALLFSTLIGGTGLDEARGLCVDSGGNIYVAGSTNSADFPLAGTPVQSSLNGTNFDAWLATLDATGSNLLFATYLGGTERDAVNGLVLDATGNAHLVGWTDSTNFPVSANALQPVSGGVRDGFVATLGSAGSSLLYSSYLGGSGTDDIAGVVFDAGSLWLTGSTNSTDFPVAGSPFQLSNGGDWDSFVARMAMGAQYSYRYWVPVASHAGGAQGSQWRTDVGLLNTGTSQANFEARFIQAGAVTTSTGFVPAGSQSILTDIVGQLGKSGSGALEIRSDQPLRVTSRTYNQTATGTYGQNYPAYQASEGLSGASPGFAEGLAAGVPGYLPQLTENAAYRTNIALTNMGTAAASVKVELFDGAGAKLAEYTVNLQPGEWKQENRPFATKASQTNLSRGYAKVTVLSGSGIIATASVVDNVTNDPTTQVMVR